jgi:two-component system chemotaxis response regulator CheY
MHTYNVLVVDDDPAIRAAICMVLDLEGYEVRAAANGQEALQEVDDACPDLVVLDMEMPILDGWGFARILHERCTEIKLLVVTSGMDGARWAQDIRAQGYLGKPFSLDQFLPEVERLCSEPAAAA